MHRSKKWDENLGVPWLRKCDNAIFIGTKSLAAHFLSADASWMCFGTPERLAESPTVEPPNWV